MPIQPQRLSETERHALADISQKQPKSAKIEEWKSLPLTTEEHRHQWWLKRCEFMSAPTLFGTNSVAQDATTAQDTWIDASPLSMQYEDMQSNTTMQLSIPNMSQSESGSPALVAPWQSAMNVTISDTDGNFNNCLRAAIRSSVTERSSEDTSDVTQVALTEPNASNDSQSLSAERWRKYF
jgi:hypothetical protein